MTIYGHRQWVYVLGECTLGTSAPMWISCMQANVATSESPSSSKAYRVHMFAAHTFPYGARSSSSLIWSARSVPYPVSVVGSVPDYACVARQGR